MSNEAFQDIPKPPRQQVAEAAYFIWLKEGQPQGRDMDFWLQAETQLVADSVQEAAKAASPQTVASAIAQVLPSVRQRKQRVSGKSRASRLAA